MIFFCLYITIKKVIKLSDNITPAKTKLSQRKGYKIYKKIRSIFLTVILAAALVIVIITMIARLSGNTPSFFGYSVFRVSSGSMTPAYEIGDVIIVKDCDPMSLNKGDVITYNGKSGEMAGKIVTHRVVKEPFKTGGEYFVKTKGDANPLEDPEVNVKDIQGKVEAKIGILRHMYNFFITPLGLITVIVLIIAAFFNEIINFVKSILGLGYEKEKKESIEDIIERYQKGNEENQNNDK